MCPNSKDIRKENAERMPEFKITDQVKKFNIFVADLQGLLHTRLESVRLNDYNQT